MTCMSGPLENSAATADLLRQAAAGDRDSLGRLLDQDRDRLSRMVALRMDPRLRGRVDASDVVQDACMEAGSRFGEYLQQTSMPFFVWLRLITQQRLAQLYRQHIGAQMRDAGREVSIYHRALPAATSEALAAKLLGKLTQPSQAAIRAEAKIRVQLAIGELSPMDREILGLRHFEQLTTGEAARELGISEDAVKKRHLRALERLRAVLTGEERMEP